MGTLRLFSRLFFYTLIIIPITWFGPTPDPSEEVYHSAVTGPTFFYGVTPR